MDAMDTPYPTRVVKTDDGYVVICSATVLAAPDEDISDVHEAVLRAAIRASHVAAVDLMREGLLVA